MLDLFKQRRYSREHQKVLDQQDRTASEWRVADAGEGGDITDMQPIIAEIDTATACDIVPLFQVNAWSVSVPPHSWWISRLVDDIVTAIAVDPMPPVEELSALRTRPTLQDRPEEHWREFFGFVRRSFEDILRSAGELRYPSFGMRAWGVLIDSDTAKKDLHHGPARIVETHNHTPAIFTSVFTCELPDYPPAGHLATVFHNPAKHFIDPWQPRVVLVPPAVGKLLIFPGWIEHSAPVVMPIAAGQRRIIISVDYFPDQTNSAFEASAPK
jgi:hypothetical protein